MKVLKGIHIDQNPIESLSHRLRDSGFSKQILAGVHMHKIPIQDMKIGHPGIQDACSVSSNNLAGLHIN